MGEKSGKTGIDPYEANWTEVKSLCGMQCTKEEVASHLGISSDTLKRCSKRDYGCTFGELRDEWSKGGKCSLRRKQWLLADKSATMAIFLGKQMLGQKDDVRLSHSGGIIQEIVHYGDGVPTKWENKEQSE